MVKICTGCKEQKPLTAFAKHSPGKLRAKCRPCQSEINSQSFAHRYRNDESFRAKHAARGKATHRSSPRAALRHSLHHAVRRFETVDPVTIDDLMNLWISQGGRCALSGIEMTWGNGEQNRIPSPFAVSLDRVDQKIGYVKGNIRLLCYCVNNFRGTMTDQQMMQVAVMLVDRGG